MESILEAINNNLSLKEILKGESKIDLNNSGKPSEEIPLHQAAIKHNKEAIEEILSFGADINCKNNEGQTALSVLAAHVQNEETNDSLDSTMKLLLEKGIEVPEDAILRFNRKTAFLLIQYDKEKKLKLPEGFSYHDIFYGTTDENRIELVTWYLNHPQFTFANQNRGGGPAELYTTIRDLVQLEQWEDAMKLAYCREGILSVYEGQLGVWNEDDEEDNLLSNIFKNMKNFNYVDCDGAKIVDIIFQMYLEEPLWLNASMGKKLLELGASKKALIKAFLEALERKGCYRDFSLDSLAKIIKRLTETGIDLDSVNTSEGEGIRMKDSVYLIAAEHGFPDLLKQMIEEGADIFINLDISSKKSSIDYCIKKPDTWISENADECLEIILREMSKQGNLQEIKVKELVSEDVEEKYKTEKLLVDYLKENGQEKILSKIGFLPMSPLNLVVSCSGATCHLEWECGEQGAYPVTGWVVQAMRMGRGQEQQRKLKELFKSNTKLNYLFENCGLEEEFDSLTGTLFQETWKTIKTAIDVGTEGLFSMLPEVDKKIQEILQETSETGTWKTVVEMMDPNKTSRDIFPLQHGSIMKFRVFALNENGLSNPPAESEFHKITVCPGAPIPLDIADWNGEYHRISWAEPENAVESCVSMYRVEVRVGGREEDGEEGQTWKVLEKVSAKYKREMRVVDLDAFAAQYTALRVIAMNDSAESSPSFYSLSGW